MLRKLLKRKKDQAPDPEPAPPSVVIKQRKLNLKTGEEILEEVPQNVPRP